MAEYNKLVGKLDDLEGSLRAEETRENEEKEEQSEKLRRSLRRKQTGRKVMQINEKLNYPNL